MTLRPDEPGGREARERPALPRHVRLIGVARGRSECGETRAGLLPGQREQPL